jgi:hypothetical protein
MGFEQSAKQLNALILRALAQQMRSRSTQVGALQIILLLAEHTPRSRFCQHPTILWLTEWERESLIWVPHNHGPSAIPVGFQWKMKPSVYKLYSARITKTILLTNLHAWLIIALTLSMNINNYWEFCKCFCRHNLIVKRLFPLVEHRSKTIETHMHVSFSIAAVARLISFALHPRESLNKNKCI